METIYALRVETLEPVRAPEVYDDSELIFVVLPEFRSVVLSELKDVPEVMLEAA